MALISFYRSKLLTRESGRSEITAVARESNGTANLSRRALIAARSWRGRVCARPLFGQETGIRSTMINVGKHEP